MKRLKQFWKKGLSLLLAAAMSLSLLPVASLAAGYMPNLITADSTHLTYNPTTGYVTGTITLSRDTAASVPHRFNIVCSSDSAITHRADIDTAISQQGNTAWKPGGNATGMMLLGHQDITVTGQNPTVDINAYLGTLDEVKAQIAKYPDHFGAATSLEYSIFIAETQNNYGYAVAFTIPLSAKAELTGTPNPIILVANDTNPETITLTNTVTGTTASEISVTVPTVNLSVFSGGGISTSNGTVTSTGFFKIEHTYTAAAGYVGDLTVSYKDNASGEAQPDLKIPVYIVADGTLKAAPIIITSIGGTGTTKITTGNLTAATAQLKVTLRTQTNGFRQNSSSGWDGAAGIWTNFQTAAVFRGTSYATNGFDDALNVTHDGVFPLTAVTQAEIDAGTATPSGYVDVVYAQGSASTINNGNRTRSLRVPIYYVPATTAIDVTFNPNGGTMSGSATGTSPATLQADASGKVTAPGVTYAGHYFLGWNNGTNTLTEAQVNAANHTANTTYTAQWGTEYTVSFNGNGSTGGSTASITSTNGTVTLPANGFTRPGWTFSGWGETAGATSTFNPGDTYPASGVLTGNKTLYAIWTQNTYDVTITLNKDGKLYPNAGINVWLSKDNGSTYSGGTAATSGSVTVANQSAGTYSVYVSSGASGAKTNTGVTVTVSTADANATVNYYTVYAKTGNGAQTAQVNGKADDVALSGTSVTLTATPTAAYAGDTATWTTAAPSGVDVAGTPGTGGSGNSLTMTVTGTTEATASYSSLASWTAKVTVRIDGAASVDASKITGVAIQTNAGDTTANASAVQGTKTYDATLSGADAGKSYNKVVVKTVSNALGYVFTLATPITNANPTATVDLYTVKAAADPAAGGSATVAGGAMAVAPADTQLEIAASANTNYTFENWTSSKASDSGIASATTASTRYTVKAQTAETTLTAHFDPHPVLQLSGPNTLTVEAGYVLGETLSVTAENVGPGDAKNVVYKISSSESTFTASNDVFTVNPTGPAALNSGTTASLTLTAVPGKGVGTYEVWLWAYETTNGTTMDTNVAVAKKKVILKVEKPGTPTAKDSSFTWDVYTQKVVAPTAGTQFSTSITLTNTFKDYTAAELTFKGLTLISGTDYTLVNNGNGTATLTIKDTFLKQRDLAANNGVYKLTLTNASSINGSADITMEIQDTMPTVDSVTLDKNSYVVGDTITVSAIGTSNSSLSTVPADSTGVVKYVWKQNGTVIATTTTKSLPATAAAGFQTGDMVTVEVWGKAKEWAGSTKGDVKPAIGDVYKESSFGTISVVLQAPNYTITLKANSMGTITGNYNGSGYSSTLTADQDISVTENGNVTLVANAEKGYKFTGWSSAPAAATTGTTNKFVTTTAPSTSYGGVTRDADIIAAFRAVTDLSESPASIALTGSVGYTVSPTGTITITNAGRLAANISVSTSDLTNSFTFGTLPTGVAAYNGTTDGTSTITVTPKPNLPAGTYSATVTITETGDADNTMSGTLQSWTIPITFTVEGSNAAVNVKLDAGFCNDELVMLRPQTGADVMMSKPTSGNNYTASGLAPSVPYTIYVNGVNTGVTVTGSTSTTPTPAIAQFWTLTLDAKAGTTAMVTKPTASGGVKITLNGSTTPAEGYLNGTSVNVSAVPTNTDAAGLSYKFMNWTGATAGTPVTTGSVTMNGAKTVTANYGLTNGIKYWKNDGTTEAAPYYTDNNGYTSADTGIILIPGPARTGYKFDGWMTSATGTSVVSSPAAASALGTASNGYYNLYAKWTKITTTITWNPSVPNGVYGVDYFAGLGTATAADNNGGTYPVTYAIQGTDTLAQAGLTLNSDGTITGKPYQTYLNATKLTFTVRATAVTPSGTETLDKTLSINIEKYTPALSVQNITGVTATGYAGAVVTGTVTAPWYDGSQWVNMSDTYPTATAPRVPNSGTVAVTAATGNSLSQNCTVKYTPGTGVTTGLAGGQVFDSVYNPVETTFVVSLGAATYTLEVTPNPKDFGSYTVGDAALQSLSQDFDVIKTGNQTIYVDYELVNASGSTDASGNFTLTKAAGTRHELTDAAGTKTGAFTVAPRASILGTPGNYVTYVKVSAYAAKTGGDAKYSILVPVMLEIKNPENFDATVEVYENPVAGGHNLKTIADIQLVSLTSGAILGPDSLTPATAGTYTWTGAGTSRASNRPVYGELYKVQVKYDATWAFEDVPDVVVKFDANDEDVNFYELKLEHNPAAISPNKKLDGSTTLNKYLLKGMSAKAETENVNQYTFNGWKNGSAVVGNGLMYSHVMGAAATTLVADYTREGDKYNVTYSAGSCNGVTAPASVAVPVDKNSPYDSGKPVTVLAMNGVWPGYTFKNWTDGTSSYNANDTFAITADTVLTAVWEKTPAGDWSDLPDGVYGSSYSGRVSLSNAAALGVTEYTVTAGSLPDGLEMAKDGSVTGRPYASAGSYTFTVTASNADGSLTWTKEYTIEIDKAQPIITKATVSNVQVGAALTTATVTATVSAPYWDPTANSNKGDWVQNDRQVDMTVGTPSVPDIGALTATMNNPAFQVSGNVVDLLYTPSATTNTGLTGQVYDNIYKTATFQTTVSAGAATYDITVDPTVIKFTVTRDKGNYVPSLTDVAQRTVTVTNHGNQDAYVTYTKVTGADAGKFILDPDNANTHKIDATTGAVKNTDTFTVMADYDDVVGTYTAQIRVDNYASDADKGDPTKIKFTQYVTLILEVVEQETFTATVDVYETAVGGSPALTDVTDIRLMPVGSAAGDVALTKVSTGKYSTDDALYGTVYEIQVKHRGYSDWTVVPGITIKADDANKRVDFYEIKLTQNPANAGATLTLNGTAGTAGADVSAYFLNGVTITAQTSVPGGYNFVDWTPGNLKTTLINHTVAAAATLTANFEEITVYTVTFDPNGGSLTVAGATATTGQVTGANAESMLTSGSNGFNTGDIIGVHTPGTSSYEIVQAGYTFRGWALESGKTGSSGSYGFTANQNSDNEDSGKDNQNIVLYAVWTKDSDIAFSDAVVKGVYKHTSLTQTGGVASGGTGTYNSYDLAALPAGNKIPFAIGNGPLTGGSVFTAAAAGAPNDTGTDTARITVTDSANASATATYTFIIDKADVEPASPLPGTGNEPPAKVAVDTDPDVVKAAIEKEFNDNAPMNGKGTGETNVNGTWTVEGNVPTTPGKHTVTLVFTPENEATINDLQDKYGDHYNEYTTTVEIEVEAKYITGAALDVTPPSTGSVPMDQSQLAAKNDVTNSLESDDGNKATYANDVEIVGMSWTPNHNPFQANVAYTVTVTLHIKDGSPYEFKTTQQGGSYDFNGQIAGHKAVVQSISKDYVTLQYTFPTEDRVIDKIHVTTPNPAVDGNGSTAGVDVVPADRLKYQVVTANSHWYDVGTTTLVDSSHKFEAEKLYDLVVQVKALEGYQFSRDLFDNKNVGDLLQSAGAWDADVNGGTGPEGAQQNKVEVVLGQDTDGRDILTIRFTAFKPTDKTVARIEWLEGTLDTTIYYATTTRDQKSAANDDIKAGVPDHKMGINAIFSDANTKAPIKFKVIYTDGTEDTMTYDRAYNSLSYLDAAKTYQTLADGYVFTNILTTTYSAIVLQRDQDTFDGQSVFLAYHKDGQTYHASVPVATLTVRELQADDLKLTAPVTPGDGWPTLRYEPSTGGGAIPFVVATNKIGASVYFNTDSVNKLANTLALAGSDYSATSGTENNGGVGRYFFEVGPENSPTLTLHGDGWVKGTAVGITPIEAGADVSGMDGQMLYLSYLDVNNNVVRAPIGIIRIGSDFEVAVTDENNHDPEYGDKLTAVPDTPGDYEYQWEKKDPTTGEWKPIPGATSPDYVPTKDDIDDTIRVKVKDKETDSEKTSEELLIYKRSVNFDVAPHDKWKDGNKLNNNDTDYNGYETKDFTLSQAVDTTDSSKYGGVLLADQGNVSLDLKDKLDIVGTETGTTDQRPMYAGAEVGDQITWPAITKDDNTEATDKTGGYTFVTGGDWYRLAPQTSRFPRGIIKQPDDTTKYVTHVDVFFTEKPVAGKTIPTAPNKVTKAGETVSGEAGNQTYIASWFTGATSDTQRGTAPAATTKFLPDTYYTVEVKVKPGTGYGYRPGFKVEDTAFFYHFGDVLSVERTQQIIDDAQPAADGTWTMWYTLKTEPAPMPTGLKDFAGLVDTYYAKTGTTDHHFKVNTTDNTDIPGGKANIDFTFDYSQITGKVVYADGSEKSLKVAVADDGDESTLEYGTGWRLVYGTDANDAVGQYLDGGATAYTGHTFTDTVNLPTSANTGDSQSYDGKKVFVEVDGTVLGTAVGTLTVKELTAESIAATGSPKLYYTDAEAAAGFVTTGVTGATVRFNQDSMKVGYTGATEANGADTEGKKYYFELEDGTALPSGTKLVKATHNGKQVYICYTDVNNHEVRSLLGTLVIEDKPNNPTSTAAIYIVNLDRANPDTQYGDRLQAVVVGASSADVEYVWERKNTAGGWDVIQKNSADVTNTVADPNYIASKADVGTEVRVRLTKDGTYTLPTKDASEAVPVAQKVITAQWTWTPGSKNWDGTNTAEADSGNNFTYDVAGFKAQLVEDFFDTKDDFTLTNVTAATFDNANVGYNKPIDFTTGGTLPSDANNWDNYYELEKSGPTGHILALQLGWDDFKFIGKVKRYDGSATVYDADNFSLTADNSGTAYGSGVTGQNNGLWEVENTSGKFTPDQVNAIYTAVKANNVSYTSSASLENRTPITSATKTNGHSVISLTLEGNDNIKVPSGTYYVKDSAINPKQIKVGVTDLNAVSLKLTRPQTSLIATGTAKPPKTVGSETADFSIYAVTTAPYGDTDTKTQVTVDPSKLTWTDNNYLMEWDGPQVADVTITGGIPTEIKVIKNGSVVYGDGYDTIKGAEFEVKFDDGSTQNYTSFGSLVGLGITAVVAHENNADSSLEYSFIIAPDGVVALAGWDLGTANTAKVSYKFFLNAEATDTPATLWAMRAVSLLTMTGETPAITVEQREINATSAWDLAAAGKDGKYYDGGVTVAGTVKDATVADLNTADHTGVMTYTYSNKGTGEAFAHDTVSFADAVSSFAGKDAGDNKPITTTASTLTGAQANRYKVGSIEPTTGNIKPRPVQVKFDSPTVPIDPNDAAASKKVNLNQNFASTDSNATGLVSGDSITVAAVGVYDTVVNPLTAGVDGLSNVEVKDLVWHNPNYIVTAKTDVNGEAKIDGNVTPKPISNVAVTYTVPVAGATAAEETGYSNTKEVTNPTTQWYEVGNKTDWTNTGKPVNIGDPFEAGKYYMVTSTVDELTGYQFTNETQFTLNGVECTEADSTLVKNADGTYTLKQIWKVPDVEVDKTIVKVAAGVTAPVAGDTVNTTVNLTTALNKKGEELKNHVEVSAATWTEKGSTTAVSKFEGGKEYTATFDVSVKTASVAQGYEFLAENPDFVDFLINGVGWVNGSEDMTSGGIKVTTEQKGDSNSYTVTVTFPKTATDAAILNVVGHAVEPVAGVTAAPAQITVAASEPYEIVTNTNKWYSDAACTTEFTGKFVPGETYYAKLTVQMKAGQAYRFSETTDGYINAADGETTVTRDPATGDPTTITLVRPFTVPEANEVLIVNGWVVEPKAKTNAAANQITVKAEEPYKITTGTNNWYESQADALAGTNPFTGQFQAGKTYWAKMTVELKDANTHRFTANTKGYINGETPDTKQFDATERTMIQSFEIPRETVEVHVNSIQPTSGASASTVNPTIKVPAAYQDMYELVGGADDVWYENNGTTKVTTFQEDTTYKLIVKVRPKGDYLLPPVTSKGQYIWDDSNKSAFDVKDNGDGTHTVTFTHYIPKDGEVLPNQLAVVVTPPVAGRTPDKTGKPGNNDTNVVSQVTWTKTGATEEVSKFDYNTRYTAKVDVEPKDPDKFDWTSPEYKFNGVSPSRFEKHDDGTVTLEYDFPATAPKETITVPSGGGGGGGTTIIETPVVTYALRDLGVTLDLTAEKVAKNKNPKAVPKVEGITGLKFVGWSETDPSKITNGKLPTLVDPTTFKITADKTFYAVYERTAEFDHSHYVIGFPNGTFGPDSQITRGQVATIIARSCLDNFIEGGAYGNPGNYTDVESHWALSAISYCSMNGVFTGYGDGTFRPDRYITRQELATVVARLAGVQVNQGLPFSDTGDIAAWAVNGVYTNYANGWVNGYTDGTFKPLNDISRAETVKIFNGYLGRGTDKEGLSELKEYVHYGVASNNQENGKDEYMTWPDVAKTHWAYYEIIEAANDHNFHWRDTSKETPPEDWYECYIDEKWRYDDDANDGADNVGQDNTLPVYTVTYVVQSNGVVWDSITEQVTKFSSPDPAKLPQAVPSEGFRFAGWSDVDPDTGVINIVEPDPTAFPVLEDRTFYAIFEPDVYVMPKVTITYVIGEHGTTDMALTEVIDMWASPDPNKMPEITAHEGWRFAGWSETDPATGTITPTDPTDHPATADATFYALYEAEQPVAPVGPEQPTEPEQPTQPEQTEKPVPSVRYSYINGYEDNTFHPDDPFTRATVAAIIANLKGYDPSASYDAPAFDDLEGHWAANAIAFCVSQGLMSGYTDNTFRPDNAISRQEFAVVLTRVAGETQSGELPFADKDVIAPYAADSVYTAYVRGWIGGYDDGTFLPERNVTRAEAVKMFNGYLGRAADREFIESQSGYTVFDDVPTTHWAYYEIIEATNTWGL